MTESPNSSIRPAALVTGSAIRLGKAIALALAGAGYDIALHYRSSHAAAEETARAIRALGAACEPVQADLAQTESLAPLVDAAADRLPGLSVLVNSASAYTQASLRDTTPTLFDDQFAVNLRAPFFLTQAFARRVGKGVVINVLDNKIGFNQWQYAAYLLSKKALAEFTRMAALELAPAFRVNGVAPGVVLPASSRSDEYLAWRVEGIPLQRQGDAAHITGAILNLIDNPFITGQILVVDGGEAITNAGRSAGDYTQDKV